MKCDKVSDCEDESDESPLRCNLIETFEEKEPSHPETIARWICDDRRMTISRYQVRWLNLHLLCFDFKHFLKVSTDIWNLLTNKEIHTKREWIIKTTIPNHKLLPLMFLVVRRPS